MTRDIQAWNLTGVYEVQSIGIVKRKSNHSIVHRLAIMPTAVTDTFRAASMWFLRETLKAQKASTPYMMTRARRVITSIIMRQGHPVSLVRWS